MPCHTQELTVPRASSPGKRFQPYGASQTKQTWGQGTTVGRTADRDRMPPASTNTCRRSGPHGTMRGRP